MRTGESETSDARLQGQTKLLDQARDRPATGDGEAVIAERQSARETQLGTLAPPGPFVAVFEPAVPFDAAALELPELRDDLIWSADQCGILAGEVGFGEACRVLVTLRPRAARQRADRRQGFSAQREA